MTDTRLGICIAFATQIVVKGVTEIHG